MKNRYQWFGLVFAVLIMASGALAITNQPSTTDFTLLVGQSFSLTKQQLQASTINATALKVTLASFTPSCAEAATVSGCGEQEKVSITVEYTPTGGTATSETFSMDATPENQSKTIPAISANLQARSFSYIMPALPGKHAASFRVSNSSATDNSGSGDNSGSNTDSGPTTNPDSNTGSDSNQTLCPAHGLQCNESNDWVQECDAASGKWYNSEFCFDGCENGQCKVQNDLFIKLNEPFSRLSNQQAIFYGSDQKIYFYISGYHESNCPSCTGENCAYCDPKPYISVNAYQGEFRSTAPQLMLALHEKESKGVFGYTLTFQKHENNQNWFVLSSTATDSTFSVELEKQFSLKNDQIALVKQNNETVSKLSLLGAARSSTCQTQGSTASSPCMQSTIAKFSASTPNGIFAFSLQAGEQFEAGGLIYYLDNLTPIPDAAIGNAGYTAVMHVGKPAVSSDYQKVSLDKAFQVQAESRVLVMDTLLNLHIVKLDETNQRVVFEALQPITKQPNQPDASMPNATAQQPLVITPTSSASTVAKQVAISSSGASNQPVVIDISYAGYYEATPGNPVKILGQSVEVNWVKLTNGKLLAEMVVRKDPGQQSIRVQLDELFKLQPYDTAFVMDSGAETLKVTLLETSVLKCENQEKCMAHAQAKIELSLNPLPCASNKQCPPGVGMTTVLSAGETTALGPYSVRLAYVDTETASLVVSKDETDQLAYLNTEFQLAINQVAQVVGENVYLNLQDSQDQTVVASVYKKEPTGTSPAMQIKVQPGNDFSAFGLRFSFIGWVGKSMITRWVVSRDDSGTQNVPLGEKFTLLIGGNANVVNANLQMQLLNIQQPACEIPPTSAEGTIPTTSIDAIKNCTNKKSIASIALRSIIPSTPPVPVPAGGTTTQQAPAIDSSVIQQILQKVLPQRITNDVAGQEQLIPTAQSVFKLGVGEKVSYRGFEITLLDLSLDRAVFVVEKTSDTPPLVTNIEKGWNLYSIPNMKVASSNCDSTQFRLFEYQNNEFVKIQDPKQYHAYWLYNKGDACEVQFSYLDQESFTGLAPLQEGWNFVPVIGPMDGKKASELGCTLQGAFLFENGQWSSLKDRAFSLKDLGKAFVVYSKTACSLNGEENLVPPPMPQLPIVDLTNQKVIQ